MLLALALAAVLETPRPVQADEASKAAALGARYEALYRLVNEPRILSPVVRDGLVERTALGAQTAKALAQESNPALLEDLTHRVDLDEVAVVGLLDPAKRAAPSALPGPHVAFARAGNHDEAFAYWIPAGYDAQRPGPLVVLFHGAIQPETDFVARSFFRELADAAGAVVLAPGGDDRRPEVMAESLDAAERVLRGSVAWDAKRRYVGGFSNGVFDAFHAVAVSHEPCAGFIAIAGFMLPEDAYGVGLQLYRRRAYVLIGTDDQVIPLRDARAVVSRLLREQVDARITEVPNVPHSLRLLYPAIAAAWREMIGGVRSR
jgi:dienelactone hydrolase